MGADAEALHPHTPSLPLSLGALHCWQLLRNLALYDSTNLGALQCWQLLQNLALYGVGYPKYVLHATDLLFQPKTATGRPARLKHRVV